MKELTHFIGGAHVAGESGRFGDVFNPATGEVQAKVPFASRDELDLAVEAAQRVFPEWSGLNPQRRARVMFNFKRWSRRTWTSSRSCCRASTARSSPIPRATFSAASK